MTAEPNELEAALYLDLCTKAAVEARRATIRVAELAPVEMRGGIFLASAQMVTLGAVQTFVAMSSETPPKVEDAFKDPRVAALFVELAKAWTLAPDEAAMSRAFAGSLIALRGMKVRVTE